MRKLYIVRSTRDFDKIMHEGTCLKNRSFVVYSLKNDLPYNRYGISVSKKHGNAVFRNKQKRIIRNIIDNDKKDYLNNKDYIIILRKGALERNFQEKTNDLLELLK
ncbi:MAG: ribonuclease P protein component [Bacilli bacterium]|nr:ribonuclease P protein component [Bacilli bacterium]